MGVKRTRGPTVHPSSVYKARTYSHLVFVNVQFYRWLTQNVMYGAWPPL